MREFGERAKVYKQSTNNSSQKQLLFVAIYEFVYQKHARSVGRPEIGGGVPRVWRDCVAHGRIDDASDKT